MIKSFSSYYILQCFKLIVMSLTDLHFLQQHFGLNKFYIHSKTFITVLLIIKPVILLDYICVTPQEAGTEGTDLFYVVKRTFSN